MNWRYWLLLLIVIGGAPFLFGDAMWLMGGANRLDIEGVAAVVDRSGEDAELGLGWPAYGVA